jgi:hypothetical protein
VGSKVSGYGGCLSTVIFVHDKMIIKVTLIKYLCKLYCALKAVYGIYSKEASLLWLTSKYSSKMISPLPLILDSRVPGNGWAKRLGPYLYVLGIGRYACWP